MLNKLVNTMTLGLVAILVAGTLVMPLSVLAQTALTGSITAPADGSTFQVGEAIDFTASASGGVTPYTYEWEIGGGDAFGTSLNFIFDTAGTKTVNLTVTDNAGTVVTDSITLTITEDGGTPDLTISNIRIENVTTSGATLKWTTNRPATSRVIYDTQSHPSITGASAPNYGYANSTGTTDTTTKVTEHVVTLSGLNDNTQYFFRVISEE